MRAAGVLVGVSAQADPGIRELNFGHRDAERLHAIFADANLAAGVRPDLLHLLTNQTATCEAVRAALRDAANAVNAGHADILILHFSCHGTQRGQLVLHDTDIDRVNDTTVGLHELAEAVAGIPEAQVVITLDACFSGSFLGQPGSLNRDAFDHFMQPLRGEGRFVVWAAGPDEEAYESSVLAHGYLSHALADALETFRATGKRTAPVSEWLTNAIAHARELAREAGRAQTPAGYVRLGVGEMLHVPDVGEYQLKAARDVGILPVEPPLDSLVVYGFSEHEIAAIQRRLGAGATLNALQRAAIAPGGLLAGRSLMVRAPTTAGKTLVGELAILQQRRFGRKAVVLLPTRALAREQVEAFREFYGPLGLRVVMSTGEVVDDDDLFRRNQYDVAVFTYEKFAALVGARPTALDSLGVVVFDEIQMIEDESRGKTVELLLFRLRRYQQRRQWPQLVVLCAEVEDLGSFAEWLGLQPVGPGERPVPLVEGVFTSDGRWRVRDPQTGHAVIERLGWPVPVQAGRVLRYDDDHRLHMAVALATQLVREGRQVLLFATTRARAMTVAQWLAEDAGLPPVRELVDPLSGFPESDRHRARERLLACVKSGTAFHIADLEPAERRLVETAFRQGRLRALAATTTLSMGINSGTDAVIIVDVRFWQGPIRGERDLRLSEYRNMAGRAGRLLPGGPPRGSSYLIAAGQAAAQALWKRYIDPVPAGLRSRMDEEPLEDLLLALLQIRGEAGVQQLADDIGATYWGYVARRDNHWLPGVRRALEGTVERLQRDGLIRTTQPPQMAVTRLGLICATFGLRSESARRLVRGFAAVLRANEPLDDVALLALAQATVELDDVLMPRGGELVVDWPPAARGVLRNRAALYAALTDRVGLSDEEADQVIANRLHRFAGVIGWLQGMSLREIERAYSRSGEDDPVLGRLRGAVDRTADMLAPVLAVVHLERPNLASQLTEIARVLRARLEVGGSVATSRLYQLRLGLSRHECLALVGLGVHDEATLRGALAGRRPELEATLSTPRVQEVEGRLQDPKAARRRRAAGEQLLLDLVGGLTEI